MGSIQMRDRQTDKPPLLLEHDSHHQQAGCITKCGVIPETQNTQHNNNSPSGGGEDWWDGNRKNITGLLNDNR